MMKQVRLSAAVSIAVTLVHWKKQHLFVDFSSKGLLEDIISGLYGRHHHVGGETAEGEAATKSVFNWLFNFARTENYICLEKKVTTDGDVSFITSPQSCSTSSCWTRKSHSSN